MSLLLAADETALIESFSDRLEPAEFSEAPAPFDPTSWRLLRLLGRGGMGKVYLAKRRGTSAYRALKFTRRSAVRASAAKLVGLEHPHVARVCSVAGIGNYLVTEMDYVAGRTWRQLVDDRGPLSEAANVASSSGGFETRTQRRSRWGRKSTSRRTRPASRGRRSRACRPARCSPVSNGSDLAASTSLRFADRCRSPRSRAYRRPADTSPPRSTS